MTDTPAAAEGPAFETVKVNVTFEPTSGVASLTAFVIDTSAWATGAGVSVSVLLPGVGSSVVLVTVAVFAYGPVALTVATMSSVADAALARAPTVHTPVPLSYAPVLAVADTKE